MRKITLSLMVLILVFAGGCQKPVDLEAEKAAIKEVILAETKAAVEMRSFEAFAETWVQEPYSLWISAGQNGYYEFAGWDSMYTAFKNWMEESPEPGKPRIKENFTFRIWGKGAWVFFEEYPEGKKAEDPAFIPSRQFRVLEKTGSGWKILFVGVVNKNSYRESDSE
jgi:hypothetical protein